MRVGVIDIGSSSTKLLIGERHGEDVKIIESLRNNVPLGRHAFLKSRIPQTIINQTALVLQKYKETLKEYDVKEVSVIATTAVREARNQDIFLDTVLRKTGFKIDVLNVGDVVYYIDYYLYHKLQKTYPVGEKNLLIAELGAGSLDMSVMARGLTLMNIGFPIGTLRLSQFMENLEGSMQEIHEATEEYIENEILFLKKNNPGLVIDDIILIDENYSVFIQNILPNKRRDSDFFKFKSSEAQEFLSRLREMNPENIARTYNIPADISTTIIGFAIILNTLLKLTKNEHVYILEASLSEAIMANQLFRLEATEKTDKLSQLISVAHFMCRKYGMDLEHLKHVAFITEKLFDAFKDILGLTQQDRLYLILAAYFHDLGMFINNRAHHKHSEYIISSSSLFRLTEDEINIIACIARYHRRSAPLKTHLVYSSLSSNQQILVQKLSALLRIANALDRSHKQKAKRMEIKFNASGDATIVVFTNDNFLLEKENFLEKRELFEEITGNKLTLTVKNQD
ncbi:MAG: HD domain-containing protein [Candidatus Omnitrophica bacterium]|nr:HD domain-containing protein [Candidatus Omnitrophota bacterium]